MPTKKYRVKLTEDERKDLKDLLNKGRIAARKQTHARILLQCDESEWRGQALHWSGGVRPYI
jgi:hypothetical protein